MIFCTLFDSNYLSRGLNLYFSLQRHCPSFHLYIFAFDEQVHEILGELDLPDATIIRLDELESKDPELFAVKSSRSVGEYCWTSTPSTVKYVLDNYDVDHCTYVDSDIYFFSDPGVLMEELGQNSVLITSHRYTAEYDQSDRSGIYCVQYVTFRKDERGLKVLNWWRDACLEWCYNRHEDGKFGDQKYLDDWLERFEGVHSLAHLGGGVAPWNVQQYSFAKNKGKIQGTELTTGNQFDLVFYHFHFVRIFTSGRVDLSPYKLEMAAKRLVYKPYLAEMNRTTKLLQEKNADRDLDSLGVSEEASGIHPLYYSLKRKLLGIYNVHKLDSLLTSVGVKVVALMEVFEIFCLETTY